MKATEFLERQHREVKELLKQALGSGDTAERRSCMDEIAAKLTAHMAMEEEIFYPAVAELQTKKVEDLVPKAYEEHHVAKLCSPKVRRSTRTTSASRRK